MNLSIKGQHIDIGDSLSNHVEEKLTLIKQKYFNRVTDAQVNFSKEGQHMFRVHIAFHVGRGVKVQASAQNHDAYAAFDEAANRVSKQLARYKNKLRDHHDRLEKTPDTAFLAARDYQLASEDPEVESVKEEHVIVAEETTTIAAMSVSEAVMRMDLAEQDFMLFKNPKTETLNIVYRRPDGNIGWIDPNLAAGVPSSAAA